ncbi:hypothetical protein ACOSQ4_020587 [Xanthoceras sorbifolium]
MHCEGRILSLKDAPTSDCCLSLGNREHFINNWKQNPESNGYQTCLCANQLKVENVYQENADNRLRIIAEGAGQERLSDCICTVDQQDVKRSHAPQISITFGHVNGIRADVTFHVLASTTLIEEDAESQLKRKL